MRDDIRQRVSSSADRRRERERRARGPVNRETAARAGPYRVFRVAAPACAGRVARRRSSSGRASRDATQRDARRVRPPSAVAVLDSSSSSSAV